MVVSNLLNQLARLVAIEIGSGGHRAGVYGSFITKLDAPSDYQGMRIIVKRRGCG